MKLDLGIGSRLNLGFESFELTEDGGTRPTYAKCAFKGSPEGSYGGRVCLATACLALERADGRHVHWEVVKGSV
jgi:hypothetical protein